MNRAQLLGLRYMGMEMRGGYVKRIVHELSAREMALLSHWLSPDGNHATDSNGIQWRWVKISNKWVRV